MILRDFDRDLLQMDDYFKNDFMFNYSENDGANNQELMIARIISPVPFKQKQIIQKRLDCVKPTKEQLTKYQSKYNTYQHCK